MWRLIDVQMPDLKAQIRLAGARTSAVLIRGAPGTGKGLIARQVHAASSRSRGPFVPVDCATLGGSAESQLFGKAKRTGAGTGEPTLGSFRSAQDGTLFLGGIDQLPFQLQAQVYSCIKDRVVIPLGASRPIPVDVRVVAAVSSDLEPVVACGEFHEGLFNCLMALCLDVPPLRARPADVVALARQFLDALAVFHVDDRRELTPGAQRVLESHSWPGDVRELADVIQRAHVAAPGNRISAQIVRSLLGSEMSTPHPKEVKL